MDTAMTNFNFYMPVRTVFGEGAVLRARDELIRGKHAFIVTGRHSAKLCGALDDVTALLDEAGVGYTIFDRIGENPLLSVCFDGGQLAAKSGADFVIGIGGGSPLDAAKAIAAFAANPRISPDALFTDDLAPSLELVCITTTSGTGSEVNNYSVLTLDGENKKKTFKNKYSFAKLAVLDPKYTESLGYSYTVSTALDAFCHCLESYLSPKSTDISSMFALYGAKKLWHGFAALRTDSETLFKSPGSVEAKALRAELMAAACAGGVAINTTGTGFPHPLGYSLTLMKGISHGRACAAFTGEYIKYNMKTERGERRLREFSAYIGAGIEEIAHEIPALADVKLKLDEETRREYVDLVSGAGNYANSPYVLSYEEMLDVYRRLFI